jgi:indole-3-glycerol phosphate synthase
MTILDTILEHKRKELTIKTVQIPLKELEKLPGFVKKPVSLTEALLNRDRTGIIAEFKRKSPSKGILNNHVTIEEVTTGYFRAGASALSILTDSEFFGGSAEDLVRTRELIPIPILCKDFIIDDYQVFEAKALGADAILLIASALEFNTIKQLAKRARDLQLQVILEIHNTAELTMVNEFISIIGVNNRDLRDFSVDVNRSLELADKIPASFLRISESGITSALVIKQLKNCGFQGFLIGEIFMRMPDPAVAFAEFNEQLL